jgi:hypothetical protein
VSSRGKIKISVADVSAIANSNISGAAKSHETIEESSLNVDTAPCTVGISNLSHPIISMGQPAPYVPESVDDQHAVKGSQKAAPNVFNNNKSLQNLN